MKSTFRFVRRKNKFYWENHTYRIEFSSPSGQAYDDYGTIESVKNIMYFYYTMAIYRKAHSYKEKMTEDGLDDVCYEYWKRLCVARTHDFPCVEQLEEIIEILLACDTSVDGEKHEYRSGAIEYSKHYCSEGFGCDDFYELTKFTNPKTKETRYVLYVGVSSHPMGSIESEGVRIPYLTEKDMKTLLTCVREFFKYTVHTHNRLVMERVNNAPKLYQIIGGNLYEFHDNGVIEHIYAIGDEIDTLVEYKFGENGKVSSVRHSNSYIRKLENGKIICENKYKYYDGEELPELFEVELSKIAYMCNEVTNEMLAYNREEVANDFYSIMSDIEKEDFAKLSNEELLKKYREAIIGRTWMCRDEHGFGEEYSSYRSDNEPFGINVVVNDVITTIKKLNDCCE